MMRKKANTQLSAIGPLLLVPSRVAMKHDVPVIMKPMKIHITRPNMRLS